MTLGPHRRHAVRLLDDADGVRNPDPIARRVAETLAPEQSVAGRKDLALVVSQRLLAMLDQLRKDGS